MFIQVLFTLRTRGNTAVRPVGPQPVTASSVTSGAACICLSLQLGPRRFQHQTSRQCESLDTSKLINLLNNFSWISSNHLPQEYWGHADFFSWDLLCD